MHDVSLGDCESQAYWEFVIRWRSPILKRFSVAQIIYCLLMSSLLCTVWRDFSRCLLLMVLLHPVAMCSCITGSAGTHLLLRYCIWEVYPWRHSLARRSTCRPKKKKRDKCLTDPAERPVWRCSAGGGGACGLMVQLSLDLVDGVVPNVNGKQVARAVRLVCLWW